MSAADYYATVQKIYIAYYGRAADPGGLEYWADRLDSASGNLSEIIEAFAHSAESEALFSSASNEDKVIAIYQQLFNRDPDSGGLAFYTEKLLTGEMSQATIMLNVLDGAQNEDLLIVENKLEAATAFTESLEQDGTADLYAGNLAASQVRNWLSTVDDTDDSLTNATEQLSEQIQQLGEDTQLSVSNITVDEQNSTATITINRSGYLGQESSLSYSTSDQGSSDSSSNQGVASADEDYSSLSGNLTFASGENSQSIQITLTDDEIFEGNESFNLEFSDLVNAAIDQEEITITLIENDSPLFNTEDFNPTVNEDETLSGAIQATNLASSITVSYSLATQAKNGTVTLESDGSYQYLPNENHNGSDSFQVTATTDLDTEELLTLNITIDPINDAPVFSEDILSLETIENTSVQGSVNADDIDSSELTYSLNSNPSQGNVELDEQGNYTYTPNDGFSGSDSFSINVDDGAEGVDTLEVSVTVVGTSSQLSISNLTIDETEATASIDIIRSGYLLHETSLNYGMDNNTASADEDFTAISGSLTFASGETSKTIDITLIDDNLAEGEESFFLALTDLVNGTINQELIEITLNDNDEVTFNTEDFSPNVDEDNTLEGNIQATNLASGINASYSLTTQTQNGTVTLDSDGSYQYASNTNYNGSDSFQVTATTDLGTEDLLTLDITVDPINDAPVFSEDTLSLETTENVSIQGSVSADDIDSSELTYSLNNNPSQGSLELDEQGNYTYTPNDGFSGPDSFSINVDDGAEGIDTLEVSVTVIDTSTQLSTSNLTIDESESTASITITRSGYLLHETSLNYGMDNNTASAGEDFTADSGSLTFTSGETSKTIDITLTDDNLAEDEESFFLALTDIVNGTVNQDLIEITLNDNDEVAFNTEDFSPNVDEDNALEGNVQATNLASGITASYSLTTQAQNGTVTLEDDGSYQYTPNSNYNGSDSFQVSATTDLGTEDLLTLNITIASVNDAPLFSETPVTIETNANTPVQSSVSATDIDSSELSYSVTGAASQGNVVVDDQGNYTYTPTDGFSGSDSFVITVDDNDGGTDDITVQVTVNSSLEEAQQFSRTETGINTDAMLSLGDTPIESLESDEYWSNNNLTYSFNQSIPDEYNDPDLELDLTGWTSLSSAAESAVEDVMSTLEAFTDLTLTENTSDNGDIRFNAIQQTDGTAAFAYYPSPSDIGGDVFLDSESLSSADYQPGAFTYHTLIHELGHALGLKHSFESPNAIDNNLDNLDYTVMSYTEAKNLVVNFDYDAQNTSISADYEWDAMPPSFSILDVAALQAIYGVNTDSATGDNSYSLSFDDQTYLTIWDAGGEDTINVSTTTGDSHIDLRSGQLSSVDIRTIDEQIAETLDWLDDQNAPDFSDFVNGVYQDEANNLYTGENNLAITYGVWIENVITGSGNDEIRDNAINNNIQTGAGNDLIRLYEGGLDTVDGGSGEDTVALNTTSSQVSVESLGGDSYLLLGNDFAAEIIGVEILSFTDTDIALA